MLTKIFLAKTSSGLFCYTIFTNLCYTYKSTPVKNDPKNDRGCHSFMSAVKCNSLRRLKKHGGRWEFQNDQRSSSRSNSFKPMQHCHARGKNKEDL